MYMYFQQQGKVQAPRQGKVQSSQKDKVQSPKYSGFVTLFVLLCLLFLYCAFLLSLVFVWILCFMHLFREVTLSPKEFYALNPTKCLTKRDTLTTGTFWLLFMLCAENNFCLCRHYCSGGEPRPENRGQPVGHRSLLWESGQSIRI